MEKFNPTSEEDKSSAKQLTPHELLEIHLKDADHVVTDDELKNLKVGSSAEDMDVIKEIEAKEDEIKSDPQHDSPPNPYDVLKS